MLLSNDLNANGCRLRRYRQADMSGGCRKDPCYRDARLRVIVALVTARPIPSSETEGRCEGARPPGYSVSDSQCLEERRVEQPGHSLGFHRETMHNTHNHSQSHTVRIKSPITQRSHHRCSVYTQVRQMVVSASV